MSGQSSGDHVPFTRELKNIPIIEGGSKRETKILFYLPYGEDLFPSKEESEDAPYNFLQ